MRNKLALAAVLCLTCCNNYGPRVVDYPFIRSANTDGHDIQKIELTDTATFVTVHTVYYPNSWVFWNEETKIIADGRDYMIKGGIGMTPGEKLWMEATMATGKTIIENVAKEPHVVDLANFLNSMGADIKGAGTDVIRIKGVSRLHGTEYTIIPDHHNILQQVCCLN